MAPIRVIGRKQRLFDLLTSEEGNADRGKALGVGAVLGGSVLAQMLLAPTAHAHLCGVVKSPCIPAEHAHCIVEGCEPQCNGSLFTCAAV